MQTFLTPEPITIEIRNASGEIRVDLADVATTTVDVVAATSHPLGFLDDVIQGMPEAERPPPPPLPIRVMLALSWRKKFAAWMKPLLV